MFKSNLDQMIRQYNSRLIIISNSRKNKDERENNKPHVWAGIALKVAKVNDYHKRKFQIILQYWGV